MIMSYDRRFFMIMSAVFVVVLFAALFVVSPKTHAASVYDNAYKTVDILQVGGYQNGSTDLRCGDSTYMDVSVDWSKYLLDSDYWFDSEYAPPESTMQSARTSFQTAIDYGRWGVSVAYVQKVNGVMRKEPILFWTEDTSLALKWQDLGGGDYRVVTDNGSSIHTMSMQCAGTLNDGKPWFGSYITGTDTKVSWYWNNPNIGIDHYTYVNYFVYTDYPNYPADYEGSDITQSTGPGSDERAVIKPDFTYQIDNKHIVAHDYNQNLPEFEPDEGYTVEGYSVEWSLFKCTNEDLTENGKDCGLPDDPAELVKYEILLQDKDFDFEVEEYGSYMLHASYQVQQCYRYASYPATPDYCFYVDLGSELKEYNFLTTKVPLIVDGTSFSGDTKDLVCDDEGFCIPAGIICDDEENFMLVVICKVEREFNFGVINPSLSAFKNLFLSFIVPSNPQCQLQFRDFTFSSGKKFSFSSFGSNICTTSATFRGAFPISVLLVNFAFAMGLFILIVGIINKLTDNEKHDLVEGV